MQTMQSTIAEMLLTNPENGEDMFLASGIQNNEDGSYSFEVSNADNTTRYRHTIKTEERII